MNDKIQTFAQHDFSKTVEKKFYYSEIFYSIQGEGHYTGVPTAWIRFFLCNLQCNGFGQLDPKGGVRGVIPSKQKY